MRLQTHGYDGYVCKRFCRIRAIKRTNVVLEVHTQTQKLRTSRVLFLDPQGSNLNLDQRVISESEGLTSLGLNIVFLLRAA
eukprot:15364935-Ditylum_brightwellii.AAC.1